MLLFKIIIFFKYLEIFLFEILSFDLSINLIKLVNVNDFVKRLKIVYFFLILCLFEFFLYV